MSKQLTLRGVSAALADRLGALARQRGQSINTTALELLEQALGVRAREQRFKRYATWSTGEVEEFDGLIREQRVIDDKLWK